ncbi:unnamed protein product [Mytilus coruscus]|uniref:Ig-like domain-containing protein n=1 Tax=Mytilus coruscus TaxID=42192 RepID=A0A6J8EIV9_MYTCO|nr:unnamed protein product [Mytilus coruscus]
MNGSWQRWRYRKSFVYLLVLHLLTPDVTVSGEGVAWSLQTNPAVFGKDVVLECTLPSSTCCDRYTRRWLGGKNLPLLVMDDYPVEPIDVNVTVEIGNVLQVSAALKPVFPKPKCKASIDEEDISESLRVSQIMKDLFYEVIIHIRYTSTSSICAILLNITCQIGTNMLVIKRNITCRVDSPVNDVTLKFLKIVLPIVLCNFVISCAIICICEHRNRN